MKDVEQNDLRFSSFDLILIDYQMPLMDGNKASDLIRNYLYKKNITQPIIICLTGHVEESYIRRSLESGINQVLSKPVTLHLIRKTL